VNIKLPERFHGPKGTLAALVFAILVGAAITVNAILVFIWAEQSRALKLRAEAVAAQTSTALDAHLRTLQELGRLLAAEPSVQTAMAGASEETLIAAQRDIADRLGPYYSVQLVVMGDLGIAAPEFAPSRLRNNREIHRVGEVFSGQPATAEAFLDEGEWVLSVASRIALASTESAGGVVLLRVPLDALLKNHLMPQFVDGELSLWAAPAGETLQEAARTGKSSDADLFTTPTSVAGLRAGFRPSKTFVEASDISALDMLVFSVLAWGAVVLLVVVGFAQLQRLLRQDVARLQESARARGMPVSAEELQFEELVPLLNTVQRLRSDLQDALRRVRGQASATTAAAEAQDPALEIEEILEIKAAAREPTTAPVASLATSVPATVFRAYDIRGRNSELSPDLAKAVGRAVGTEALEAGIRSVIVGADGRESSPMLLENLVQGLISTGIEVTGIGTVATPMLYFACHHLGSQTGVMVTGSHNPADHNGFKVMIGGETLCGDRITALRNRIEHGQFLSGVGGYTAVSVNEDYIKAICEDVVIARPLRIVIDCGNGAASVVAEELFRALGCEVIPLFCELDARFPNHAPDPAAPTSLRQLIAEVAARKADLGIAFDGDGDRIGVVSGGGRIVSADRLLMLIAKDVLARSPGADIVFDVKCSRDLATLIAENGGRPLLCRSGHSWIKQKMKESGALLGGEFTGHVCFRDRWFGFDDALYCAARLLEILGSEGKSIDEMIATLPRSISTPEIAIQVREAEKFELMSRIERHFLPEGARLVRVDGVRAEFRDGWGLVRASNTSAALSCRFEATDERALSRIQECFREDLMILLPEYTIPF
jgi:phosphomannomutase/phosphoglucomutase